MINSINTNYKGYNFRSRLEARWAVYFDAIGLKWEYEKEGYILENGIRYLPDFAIEEFGFIEIKGQEPNNAEKRKARLLASGLKCNVAIFVGTPKNDGNCFIVYDENGNETCEIIYSAYSVNKWGQTPHYGKYDLTDEFSDYEPIKIARSKRFEFGGKYGNKN